MAAVFTISGGTELMSTAFATRLFAVPPEIAHDLAAAGRMADVDGVLQIEMRGHRREIVGVVIHVVAVGGLARAAVAAPVVGDDAIAALEKEHHLRVPVVGRQRPAMAEHDGLTLCPSPCRKSERRLWS